MPNNPNAKKNLKNFRNGADNRRNLEGRPKKFITALKHQGYKMAEINDCIKIMLSMTRTQLDQAANAPDATALELMIASAIETSIKRGDLSAMETLVSRSFGKPKETVELALSPEIRAAKSLYVDLIEKGGLTKEKAIARVLEVVKLSGVELTEDDILDADNIA